MEQPCQPGFPNGSSIPHGQRCGSEFYAQGMLIAFLALQFFYGLPQPGNFLFFLHGVFLDILSFLFLPFHTVPHVYAMSHQSEAFRTSVALAMIMYPDTTFFLLYRIIPYLEPYTER